MVRAILSGAKTQTRRVLKGEPPPGAQRVIRPFGDARLQWTATDPHDMEQGQLLLGDAPPCPYGQPGDRLWVRESLGYDCEWGHYFAADRKFLCELFDDEEAGTGPSYDDRMPDRSIPSIHLPRRYSRILLEITSVRVERLQAISEADAQAEGINVLPTLKGQACNIDGGPLLAGGPRLAFRDLWQSINGTDSWAANPWVWVVAFQRVNP